VDIYWPGFLILLYALCGLGFTIQGFFLLGEWITRRKQSRASVARPQ
jgi:hypothetical protein